MNQLTIKEIIALLVRASNLPIQDYYYFPDVIFIGKQKIEREKFNFLLSEGFIAEYKWDSFGKYYTITKKGENFIYSMLPSKPAVKRKRIATSYKQGCFSFA